MSFISIFKRLTSGYKSPQLFKKLIKDLNRDSIVLDIGANIGIYTKLMAKTGAKVYSYEPNPFAFERLKENCKSFKNVNLFNKAVSNKDTKTKLFFHENHEADPFKWSTGSSIDSTKPNVSSDYVEVDCVDIFKILEEKRFDIVKLDVEGHEIEILNRIIDSNVSYNFKYLFVEMHDDKMEHLKSKSEELRKRIKKMELNHFHLDWH